MLHVVCEFNEAAEADLPSYALKRPSDARCRRPMTFLQPQFRYHALADHHRREICDHKKAHKNVGAQRLGRSRHFISRGKCAKPSGLGGVCLCRRLFFPTVSVSACKDYDDRWRRQAQARSKAQAGRYKGRAEDVDRDDGNARVIAAIGPGALSKPSPAAAGATISPEIAKRARAAA